MPRSGHLLPLANRMTLSTPPNSERQQRWCAASASTTRLKDRKPQSRNPPIQPHHTPKKRDASITVEARSNSFFQHQTFRRSLAECPLPVSSGETPHRLADYAYLAWSIRRLECVLKQVIHDWPICLGRTGDQHMRGQLSSPIQFP